MVESGSLVSFSADDKVSDIFVVSSSAGLIMPSSCA